MNLITLENISKSYSEKVLLDNVSLGIETGEKIGLIGINGAGKSTLLKIVTGRDEFFNGSVIKGKNIRVEYLSQNPDFNKDFTVLEQIFRGDTPEMKLLREYETLLEDINDANYDEEKNNRLISLQGNIDDMNIWDLESDAKSILNKLGITDYTVKMGVLSGGQKKRVFLASSLITPCELLVLDEPTNHLDANSIEWLEEYINARKGALLMITHDRYFLDRVANRIIELDRGKLFSYEGNYSDFLEKKAERLALESVTEDKRQKLLIKELAWVRKGAKARTTKQKARIQRYDDLVNEEHIEVKGAIEMPFVGRRLGKKVVELYNISKSFSDRNLISDFNYIFLRDDRVGIVGDNGMGKTTLINIITGVLKQDSGTLEIGETVKIGVFTQDDKEMDGSLRAIDYVKEGGETIPTEDGTKITASQLAERFMFDGTMQYTPVSKLSGGERRRLHLLRILMEAPNVLILDEPTNDLDIETLKTLEDFLDDFMGVVIVVSHDRYFLDRICNKIFSYEGNGQIKNYSGNYSNFLISKEIENFKEKEKSVPSKIKDETKQSEQKKHEDKPKPKFTFKEQKEYEAIDDNIIKTESEIESITKKINENSSNYGLLNELVKSKRELEELLEKLYERWEYLNEILLKIEGYKTS